MSELDLFIPEGGKRALEKYTRDLTDAALRDELEPVRCRDAETDRVIAILLRQSKNNPVLVGEAGVGKTAIAEGLAQRIAAGRVPAALAQARLLMLSHLDLIAGTSFRGQYEKRLQGVIDEASRDSAWQSAGAVFNRNLSDARSDGTGTGTASDRENHAPSASAIAG